MPNISKNQHTQQQEQHHQQQLAISGWFGPYLTVKLEASPPPLHSLLAVGTSCLGPLLLWSAFSLRVVVFYF